MQLPPRQDMGTMLALAQVLPCFLSASCCRGRGVLRTRVLHDSYIQKNVGRDERVVDETHEEPRRAGGQTTLAAARDTKPSSTP